MDEQALLAFRDRLLHAGIPYRRAARQVRELRDHYHELRHEGMARGLDAAGAGAWAEQQLGSLREIAARMASSGMRRSLWHRLPRLLPLALPLTLYAIGLVALIAFIVAVLEITKTLDGAVFFDVARHPWLPPTFESLRAFVLHGLTPLVSLLLVRQQVRQQVRPGYWMVGVLLLCLLGSSTSVTLIWPDPVTQSQGVIGASVGYGWWHASDTDLRHANDLRLGINLLLSYGLGWYWRRRQQTLLAE
jgi:hypothetical protein